MRNETMTKMLKKLVYTITGAVAAFAAPLAEASVETTGDIYEIHPCDEFGNYVSRPVGTEALQGGDTARFVVRLIKPAMGPTDGRFYLVPRNPGVSAEVLETITKFEIGIYVNGTLRTATLENTFHPDETSAGKFFTDFVFTYKVEPGDFARPIRLADSAGKMITTGSDFAGAYFLSPASKTDWAVVNYTDDTKTTRDQEAKFAYRTQAEIADWGVKPPDHDTRILDLDLTKCNFYVETVDFNSTWEVEKTLTDPGLWRSVHQDSSKTEGYSPSLEVKGTPVSSVTLYVWSENEDAVYLKNGTPTTIRTDAVGGTKTVRMQEIKVVAGVTDYPFDLWGVAEGGEANLVLSAFPDYNYTSGSSGNARIADYITVPVKCLAALPPSVSVKASKTKVDVGGDYPTPALELSVEVTGIDDFTAGPCKVTLTPALRGFAGDWEKYVHVNDTYDEEAGNSWTRGGALDLSFTANGAKKVYVFALGADSDTAALAKGIEFNVAENGSSYLEKGGSTLVYFNPTVPVLDVVKKEYETTAKTPVTVDLVVSDNYKNMDDSAGYTIYKRDGAAEWAALEGKWKPDSNGYLCKLGEDGDPIVPAVHPSVKYVLEATYQTSFYVLAPNAQSSEATPVEIKVVVNKGATVSAMISANEGETWVTNGKFNEGTEMMVQVALSKPNGQENPIYAFLAPIGDAVDYVSGDVLTNSTSSYGMEIMSGETNSVAGLFKITDGTRTGKALRFSVVLCKTSTYSESEILDGYEGATLQFTAMNVVPTVAQVTMDKVAKVKESEQTMYTGSDKAPKTAVVPLGMTKKFEFKINEPGEIDLTSEALPFRLDYSVLEENGASASGELYGNPNLTNFTYKFTYAGTATVTLQLKDKDMNEMGEEFVFYVQVAKQPQIVFDAPSSVTEGAVGLANAPITLSFSDKSAPEVEGGLVAKITVTNNEATETNPLKLGYLKLGGLEPWLDEGGAPVEGAYKGTFDALGQLKFFVDDVDGTAITANKGFTVHAEVMTDSENPVAKQKWCDYYLAGDTAIYVANAAPTFTCSLGADNTVNTNATKVGIGEAISVEFSLEDIKADLDAGISVQWWDTDNKNAPLQTVKDTDNHTFDTKFKSSGTKNIRVTVTDKDKTPIFQAEWNFEVETSKILYTIANGPAEGVGNSAVSAAFAGAKGVGEGHTWSDAAFASAELFKIGWSCGLKNSVNVYAWGYKAGAVDDGNLNSESQYQHDVPLTPGGNNTTESGKSPLDSYYTYASAYDSYLFGWISHTSGDGKSGGGTGSSGLASTFCGIAPQKGDKVTAAIAALPTQNGNGSGSGATSASPGSIVYPDTYMEAVFARELLESDNMGDINGDGIPDVYYLTYDLTDSGSGEQSATGGADYKVYLKDLNWTDEGEPYCVEGDYLPSNDRAIYGQFIPGLKEEWTKVEQAFIPRIKVRGFDETDALSIANRGTSVSALNDAPALAGVAGVLPDRVYTNPRVDAKSTLNYVEWLAWSEFKAKYEIDHPGETAPVTAWSPERPTDPTKKDTDGDGMTDGYEYYFWYLAHVGWVDELGNHRRLTGRRYNPRNPGEGDFIPADDVAAAMDPLAPTGYKLRDTDNDGLPDLLEFEIGTNPFDFDTDGDGLADGWELMIAGLDPLVSSTSADALRDGERNYDGDAMALSSYKLEQAQLPVAAEIEHAKRWTFAVVDPDGDTDGVQWYATSEDPASLLAEGDPVTSWWKIVVDGIEYCVETQPAVAEGRLACDTMAYSITQYALPDPEAEEGEEETEPAGLEPARGYRVRLPAGAILDGDAEEMTEPLKVYKFAEELDATQANACWIYGKGAAKALYGEVAEIASEYGCLALGRQQAVPADRVVCAMPSDERDVAFLHYLCYQEFGFDPRTAWNPKTPLANRWARVVEGEALTGTLQLKKGGYVGMATRTREYTTYDEFLVYSFFLNNGVAMSGTTWVLSDEAGLLARTWGAFTTNPQGPNEPGLLYEDHYYGRSSVMGEEAAQNGADSDLDGVPDGWELYVMAGPKKDGAYVFAPPYAGFETANDTVMPESAFSPFVADSSHEYTLNPAYTGVMTDMMSEIRKFAGTDTCAYYANYSTTIVRPEQDAKWLNKFFPCDPWSGDTDGDCIVDSEEGSTLAAIGFIYGEPADDGKLWSIPGGGLNPLSVDTDGDGLPDRWERQFKGTNTAIYDGSVLGVIDYAKDADGNEIGNPLQGLTDGMDGTVKDAMNYPLDRTGNTVKFTIVDGVSQVVDRDYDHDGLDNWQEYLTGTMRCWRYDDPVSPMNGIAKELYFDDEGNFAPDFEALGIDTEADDGGWGEFLYKTFVDGSSPLYNPHLVTGTSSGAQYFSRLQNPWDLNYLDSGLTLGASSGTYYWFYNRTENLTYGSTGLKQFNGVTWAKRWKEALGEDNDASPAKYASCSPIDPDSDHDGMDDYYEVFHGLNPLLGESGKAGVWSSLGGRGGIHDGDAFDIVYDSLASMSGKNPMAFGTGDDASNYKNFWQRLWAKRAESVPAPGEEPEEGVEVWAGALPRGTGYDFAFYPWLGGLAAADADGDGTRNQEEAIMPLVAPTSAWHHTDPSALWMTDSSYSNSLVRTSYRLPVRSDKVEADQLADFVYTDDEGNPVTYRASDYDGIEAGATLPFKPDNWDVASDDKSMNWIASFEENEGFDSDHDGLPDQDELAGKFRGKTDPLHADSPMRRQAMYFQGAEKPSVLKTLPEVAENHPDTFKDNKYPDDMSFLQFTVECWVKPDTLDDATIIERVMWTSESSPADLEFVRCNFRLGVKGGKWYAKFDPNDTTEKTVEAPSDIPASTEWTHLAATYDGNMLRLYVNGEQHGIKPASLQPAWGSAAITLDGAGGFHADPLQTFWRSRKYKLCSILIGASAKTCAEGATRATTALDNANTTKLADGYAHFFKGYVDEVRIWDGARVMSDISGDMKVRYTAEMAAANREAFFADWSKKPDTGLYRGRYAKDGSGQPYPLPCELRYHWAFDSIFGGSDEATVAKVPAGFDYAGKDAAMTGARAMLSRPDGYEIAWWKDLLEKYGSVYAGQTNWVTWIPNTVTHLPRFDGTTLDSRYWSSDFAGVMAGTYTFERTAEPASLWTQYSRAGSGYKSTSSRNFFLSSLDFTDGTEFTLLYEFTGRHLNQSGDDLLPLGGAYARHIDQMWDGMGPSANWEIAGTDTDGDGLPDWWEDWANEQYRDDAVTKKGEIDWETVVIWPDQNGVHITAGEAYLRDIARGYHPDADGNIVMDDTDGDFRQKADTDGNGIPDWWEELYGLTGVDALADTDNDGLPNYVEYLLTEAFDFGVLFSPINPRSVDPYVNDYFYKVGDLYAGEIFTDHDLVDDAWEDLYPDAFSSRLAWDAYADADADGWSNRSENRYAKQGMPTQADKQNHYSAADGLVADYPIPTIELTLNYNESFANEVRTAPIVVQVSRNPLETADPDATFVIGQVADAQAGSGTSSKTETDKTTASYTRTLGKWSNRHALGTLTPGYINKDSISLQFCFDPDAVIYTWEVRDLSYERRAENETYYWVTRRGTRAEYDNDRRKYGEDNINLLTRDTDYKELENVELRTTPNSSVAVWSLVKAGIDFGTIDLTSGAFDINLGAFAGQYVVDSSNATDYVSMEDQTYRITYSVNPATTLPRTLYLGEAQTGYVKEGKNQIKAFFDLNGDGNYTPGEPFGAVNDVDISWKGTKVTMELCELSPVTPRINLWSVGGGAEGSGSGSGAGGSAGGSPNGASADRTRTVTEIYDEIRAKAYADYNTPIALSNRLAQLSWMDTNRIEAPTVSQGEDVRVRVVRWLVDGWPLWYLGIEPRVIVDKKFRYRAGAALTEADILADGALDLDWAHLQDEVMGSIGVSDEGLDVNEVDYLVVIGDGVTSWRDGNDSNVVVKALSQVVARKFSPTRNVARTVSPSSAQGQVVRSACPTFKWKIGGEPVTGYTAFKIQVMNKAGETVYDSGVRPAPARDDDDNYVWTAPLYVGDKTEKGVVYENDADYTWKVSMYNAKYRTDDYSSAATYKLAVQTNGTVLGTARVAVKYFGPADSFAGKTIRVRAFTSPDFTGVPVGGGYVVRPNDADSGVAVAGKPLTNENCRVVGLPKGKYYLQAFIDSNKNGVCDAWESMGYLCDRTGATADWLNPVAIEFGDKVGAGDLAVIYIEDADTDGDSLPDAWEYAKYGNLTTKGASAAGIVDVGEFVADKDLAKRLNELANNQGVTSGVAGEILYTFRSSKAFMALASGVAPEAFDPQVEIAITGLAFNAAENAVEITFGGDVTDPGQSIANALYTYKPGETLRFQVYHTDNLAEEWKPVGDVRSVEIKSGNVAETLKVGMEGLKVKGGFFRVVVVP